MIEAMELTPELVYPIYLSACVDRYIFFSFYYLHKHYSLFFSFNVLSRIQEVKE